MFVKMTDDTASALGNLEQAVSVVRNFFSFQWGPLLCLTFLVGKLPEAGNLFVCMFIKRH